MSADSSSLRLTTIKMLIEARDEPRRKLSQLLTHFHILMFYIVYSELDTGRRKGLKSPIGSVVDSCYL